MKMGRPQIKPEQRKQTILTLRVKDEEAETLEQAAQREGLKLSVWARQTLLQAAGQTQGQAG